MGCNCGKGGRGMVTKTGDTTLGYRVTLPNGTTVPPENEAPFFTVLEARVEQRAAGGGTIRRIVKPANGAAP